MWLGLEEGVNLNERDENKRTPLHWACQEGYLNIVRLLIESGAAVNAADNQGFTPLVTAAGEGHNAVVRELCKAGASANARVRGNADGTALHLACSWNRNETVKVLIEFSNADINARDRNGKTPLAYALETRNEKLATYLAKHGGIT